MSDQRGWLQPFLDACGSNLTYMHTSGGRTDAASQRIRTADVTTWAQVHEITGRGLIADTGYGVGGDATGHDDAWDVPSNLDARMADGVIALTQASPSPSWLRGLGALRSRIRHPAIRVGERNDCLARTLVPLGNGTRASASMLRQWLPAALANGLIDGAGDARMLWLVAVLLLSACCLSKVVCAHMGRARGTDRGRARQRGQPPLVASATRVGRKRMSRVGPGADHELLEQDAFL